MAEETENSKISLSETSNRVASSVVYTLQVPNFFTLPEYDAASFKLGSPSFEAADAKWCFRLSSTETIDNSKMFEVHLVRLNSALPKHRIFYHMTLPDDGESGDGDEDNNEFAGMSIYDKDGDEQEIGFFQNHKSSFNGSDSLILTIHLIFVNYVVGANQVSLETDKGLSLSRDFKDVLLNGQDYNLAFDVKGKRFRAHQDVLRARSEVFCSMLSHDMIEKNSGVIDVPDCDPLAFEQLLCYIYTGRIELLDENNVFGLYYAADKYHLPHLKEQCCDFISSSLTVINICSALHLALRHSDASLRESASTYFFNNLDDILTTEEWQLFLKENPTAANELFIKSVKKLRDTKT